MKWFRIAKEVSRPSSQTSYQGWKSELAVEGRHQCVYCCISEASFGGFRNFHVEHLRPKAKFPHLLRSYENLFYVCAVCNAFKVDDWPSDDEDAKIACYLDPAKVDYSGMFSVDYARGDVTPAGVAATYLVQKLHLNRPQLLLARRYWHLLLRLRAINQNLAASLTSSRITKARAVRIADLMTKISEVMIRAAQARPYAPDDLR